MSTMLRELEHTLRKQGNIFKLTILTAVTMLASVEQEDGGKTQRPLQGSSQHQYSRRADQRFAYRYVARGQNLEHSDRLSNLSKTRSCMSDAMPGPWSLTINWASPFFRPAVTVQLSKE